MSQLHFIGLDIETTASAMTLGGAPCRTIQIGLATGIAHTFVSDIGWQEYAYEDEALALNLFTHERIKAGPPAEIVDEEAATYLCKHFGNSRVIAVGFNVAGFDQSFVRRDLPKLASCLSYRTVDLNAVLFLTGRFEKAKKALKARAEKLIGPVTNHHDAGYDAQLALACLFLLQERITYKHDTSVLA